MLAGAVLLRDADKHKKGEGGAGSNIENSAGVKSGYAAAANGETSADPNEKAKAGIALIEKAMEADPQLYKEGCSLIAVHLFDQKKDDEAVSYLERAQLHVKAADQGHIFTRDDKFEEQRLSAEKLELLCDRFYADPRVKQAYLVCKVMPAAKGVFKLINTVFSHY